LKWREELLLNMKFLFKVLNKIFDRCYEKLLVQILIFSFREKFPRWCYCFLRNQCINIYLFLLCFVLQQQNQTEKESIMTRFLLFMKTFLKASWPCPFSVHRLVLYSVYVFEVYFNTPTVASHFLLKEES